MYDIEYTCMSGSYLKELAESNILQMFWALSLEGFRDWEVGEKSSSLHSCFLILYHKYQDFLVIFMTLFIKIKILFNDNVIFTFSKKLVKKKKEEGNHKTKIFRSTF